MKIDIKEEKENPLLYRKEVSLILKDFEETPTRKSVVKEIAKKVNTKEELISIGMIKQQYGKDEALCYAEIYDTVEHKEKYKPSKAEQKDEKKEEKPKEKVEEKKVEVTKKEEKTEVKEAE